jgi:hypothetical protein
VPDKMPGTVGRASRHGQRPWLRLAPTGPGTDTLESVSSGLDLGERSVQGTPEPLL